jgi:hypothetical protein
MSTVSFKGITGIGKSGIMKAIDIANLIQNMFTPTQLKVTSVKKSVRHSRLWSHWNMWYQAFLFEVRDEMPTITADQCVMEADNRWVTFTAKSLRCDESVVRDWLVNADQKCLLEASF